MKRGLGDTVSNAIKKVSGGRVKECGGCSKRRDWLNDKVPYRRNALDAITFYYSNTIFNFVVKLRITYLDFIFSKIYKYNF